MNRTEIVVCALALDWLIGDPHGFPHPVRWIGRFARRLETISRSLISSPFLAGALTAFTVYSVSFFVPYFLVEGASRLHPLAGDIVSIFVIYTTIALRDLVRHSADVYAALKASVAVARKKVAMIVGRDTENLSREEVVRACVESVSENLVDGVTAPLLFAIFGGPAAAMLYRSINTLDSIFGYRNERYRRFGTVSARMDDLANLIPARVTAPVIALAAAFLGLRPLTSLATWIRDGRKHPSPNSAMSEAAVAGALGIQLGGVNFYGGVESRKPFLGNAQEPLRPDHILTANRLITLSTLTIALVFLSLRFGIYGHL